MTKNLTSGNPLKLIIMFTIPLLIGNVFQQLYNAADTMIVGRTIGLDALAAVGCTGSIVFLIIGFAQGLTSGFAVVTAQKFGADDFEGVKQSVAAGAVLSFAINIVITLLCILFMKPLLSLIRTPPELMENAYEYIIVISGGTGAAIFFNLLTNIMRSVGDSRTPLYILIIACIINIILDYVFILECGMGVGGAAWATLAAQIIAGILCFEYIRRRIPVLKAEIKHFRPNSRILWEHIRIGLPMGFQISIIAIGAVILQAALNELGPIAVGAFTVAHRIDIIAVQPLMSFGITMATFTAQNYGARKIRRIHKGAYQTLFISVAFSLFAGFIIMVLADFSIKLFAGSSPENIAALPETTRLAKIYLQINCSLYSILALLFIVRNVLQGLGNSVIPTTAGVMELIMRAIAAVVLARCFGFTGISWANPIAWIGAVIPMVIAYCVIMRKLFKEYKE